MKRLWLMRGSVVAAVCIAMLAVASPAMAIWDWCYLDPEINIDGHTVEMEAMLGGESEIVADAVHGNTWFRVYVPKGIDASVVSTEEKVKVKIFQDKNLSLDENGAVVFDIVLNLNTHEDLAVRVLVTIDGVFAGEIGGGSAHPLSGRFTLP